MPETPVLIAMISIVSGVVLGCIGLMVWLVKNSEKRQDRTLKANQDLIEKSIEVSAQLTQSISSSAEASKSLEASIRASDEREHEFQKHVIESLKTLIETTSSTHDALTQPQKIEKQVVVNVGEGK